MLVKPVPITIPKNTAIPPNTGTGRFCNFLASGLSTSPLSCAILTMKGCTANTNIIDIRKGAITPNAHIYQFMCSISSFYFFRNKSLLMTKSMTIVSHVRLSPSMMNDGIPYTDSSGNMVRLRNFICRCPQKALNLLTRYIEDELIVRLS